MATRNQTIAIALISLVGTLGTAFLTSRATAKSTVDERAKELRTIHMESGSYDFDNREMHANSMDKPVEGEAKGVGFTPRLIRKHIEFGKEFSFVPVVRAGLESLDASNETNLRVQVFAENITTKGFDLRLQTWSDTRLFFVTSNWFAYEQ